MGQRAAAILLYVRSGVLTERVFMSVSFQNVSLLSCSLKSDCNNTKEASELIVTGAAQSL